LAGPDLRPLVPVIVGPTAVGKTAVAAALAVLEPVTVISADARQVYRGLDIGTAKPDRATLARVPHVGIDLIDPAERYSAGRFARDAAAWIEEVRAAGRWPVVVGGTGFYIRALADGLFREPPLDESRRTSLRRWTEGLPPADVARWAARLDRGFAGGGRQRAARGVEVALLTGRPLTWWQRTARETGAMRPWYIHLTLPREALHRRIAERVERMLAAGLVREVRALLTTVAATAPGLDGIGYREVVAMLEGRLPEAGLRDAIVIATRRYAKRQETWFRHQLRAPDAGRGAPEVWTLDAMEEPGAMAAKILDRWRAMTAHGAPLTAHR
jgi:tRNA dimethylallyltransferase